MLVKFKPTSVDATPGLRDELKRAHDALAAAERQLDAARTASSNGRKLVDELTREFERHETIEKRLANSIATNLKAALRAGGQPPSANEREVSKNSVARIEIETRRSTALQVVSELASEEHEAEQAVATARNDLNGAVQTVLRAEAAEIAARWAPLDAQARAMRAPN